MSLAVGIVDYQAGNIRSLWNALECLGVDVCMVSRAQDLVSRTHLVLPGVGAFGHCAQRLAQSGILPSLREWVFVEKRPLLGICVGMQLMGDSSEEHGIQRGLGWIGGEVRALKPLAAQVRIPHVGWNTVKFNTAFGKFEAGDSADFYFDHSFAYHHPRDGIELGVCSHGVEFSAVIQRDNLIAAQFHPEKSQEAGKRFLTSFLAMTRC